MLGDGRWLDWSTFPTGRGSEALDGDGGPSTIVMLRDITRQRKSERAREAFLEVLSHELRTPITTIFGYAKVLQRPGSNIDAADVLRDIETEADRLYRIVENLLALSRLETGIQVEGEPLLLQHLVPDAVEYEARQWPTLTFEIRLAADLPVVSGDRTYVEQVIRNLLANAAKYSDPGSTVRIVGGADESMTTVRILDSGVGIEASEADRLFDLYYRSPSTARRASGSGIGLYVCRGLIAAMGAGSGPARGPKAARSSDSACRSSPRRRMGPPARGRLETPVERRAGAAPQRPPRPHRPPRDRASDPANGHVEEGAAPRGGRPDRQPQAPAVAFPVSLRLSPSK